MIFRKSVPFVALAVSAFFFPVGAKAQGVDADKLWSQIQKMEGNPKTHPKTRQEAIKTMRDHLRAHLRALEVFIEKYPSDPRVFDAKLKQAGLIASLGTLEDSKAEIAKAYKMLSELEKTEGISRAQAADAAFQKASVLFLQARGQEEKMRTSVVTAAMNFHQRYAGDKRGPRLLAEAATICEQVPEIQKSLLETALRDTGEPQLRARLQDSLRQIGLVGSNINFAMPLLKGGEFDLAEQKGKASLLVFWSADSPQSIYWLYGFLQKAATVSPASTSIVLVSVDTSRERVGQIVKDLALPYPVCFDGKGWDSPVIRGLGVNAVPAVWVVDPAGRLVTIHAKNSFLDTLKRFGGR